MSAPTRSDAGTGAHLGSSGGDRAVRRDLLDTTEQLVAVASPSGQEGAVTDLVQHRLSRIPDLALTRIGHTLVARTRRPGAARLLLAGHVDTVPTADPPQPVRREADAVHGRGAVDMKGGVACLVVLAERLAAVAPLGLTLVMYEREELGSHRSGMHLLARRHPDVLRADAGVLLEPTGGWVEAGCQGNLRVRATFLGRPAHSARPWRGVNAVHRAAEALRRCVAHVPAVETVAGLDYRQSLQVVGIQGGGDSNVVPQRCEVVVNSRYAPNRSAESARREVADLLVGADELAVTLDSPTAPPAAAHPLLTPLVAATCNRVRPKLGWTDVGRLAQLGVPAVNFGPGDPELAHGPAEVVTVEELLFAYRRLAELLR